MLKTKESSYEFLADYEEKKRKNFRRSILFAAAAIFLLIFGLTYNTYQFNSRLRLEAFKYNEEYAHNIAESIEQSLGTTESIMHELTNSISAMPSRLITQSYIERKKEGLGLSQLFILNNDSQTITGQVVDQRIIDWVCNNDFTYHRIDIVDQEFLVIAEPLMIDGDNHALVGVLDKNKVMNLITNGNPTNSFRTYIICPDHGVIFGSNQFNKDEVIRLSIYEDVLHELELMQQDTGYVPNSAVYHDSELGDLTTTYTPLSYNQWILFTIGDSSFSQTILSTYLANYQILIVLVSLAFIIVIFWFNYRFNLLFKQMEKVTYEDRLTQGRTNVSFIIEANKRLSKNSNYSMVFINISRFKNINLQLGILQANEGLKDMYRSLESQLKKDELVCRSENDHFFLLLHSRDYATVTMRIKDMIEHLKQMEIFSVLTKELVFNVGVCLIDTTHNDLMICQDCAKIAASHCGEGKLNIRFYDDALKENLKRQDALIDHFHDALKNDEFELYLQPKVHCCTQEIAGCEALVRWNHPEYGLLFPNEFIPLFEGNSYILELDLYIFKKACQLLKRWQKEGMKVVPISVNLSRLHIIQQNDIFYTFHQIKKEMGIADNLIEFEFTESVMMEFDQLNLLKDTTQLLQKYGFRVSIDDFGWGYSSLTVLKDIDVDVIKFDRAFFLNENQRTWNIVGAFVNLAHQLNMDVVAEGIESTAQVQQLCKLGCDYIQGYVYSKPLPVAEFEKFSVKSV